MKDKYIIFLASSNELKNDRNAFGNMVRRLDDIYEKRGIRIKLFEWEDDDHAYNNRRKQDEYNDHLRSESDMFIALFHKEAGKFTIEEFDVAIEVFQSNGKKPKPYVYCRDLQVGEQETKELKEFKKRLFDEMGHYWSSYNNEDSLQFHFVMQLLLVENNHLDQLKVENGEINLDGTTIARMDNLCFVSSNEDYQRINTRLLELSALIEKAQMLTQKYPNDDDLENNLQKLIKERIDLQEELNKQQVLLFDTAKRIVQMKEEEITDRMRRAIEAFENGNVREANVILAEAELDAENARNDYRQIKILTEKKRKIFINSIKEIWLKTSTLMADISTPIVERIEKTYALYIQADEMAQEADYDKEDYCRLLYDYASFLYDYAFYEEALEIIQKQIALTSEKAISYNVKGNILYCLDMYQEALDVFNEALEIIKKDQSMDEYLTADIYNSIGNVLNRMGEFDKAIEQSQNALNSCVSEEGKRMSNSAKSFGNIAEGLWSQGSYKNALENYERALEIEKRLFGKDSKEVAITYRHIGDVYRGLSDNKKALEKYKKTLEIIEEKLGSRHPEAALTYGCIGVALMDLHKYKESLDNTKRGLAIREEIFGKENTNTAESYYWLGEIYSKHSKFQNYDTALQYYNIAHDIRKKKYGVSHYETLNVEYSIAELYINQGKNSEAIARFRKYIDNLEALKSIKPRDIVNAYYYFGKIYASTGAYDDAINYLEKALSISTVEDYSLGSIHMFFASLYKIKSNLLNSINHSVIALAIMKRINGDESHEVAYMYSTIGNIYEEIKDYDHALEYYKIALSIQERLIDTEDFGVASIYYNIGHVYDKLNDYPKALLYYNKALVWVSEHEISDTSIADVYNVIGIVYYNQGDYSHALENFLKAVDRKDESSDAGTIYYNLGNTYFAQSDFAQALDYYLKAKPIREKDLGKNHPDVVSLYRDIGLVYCQMGKSSKALEYLDDLLKVLKYHEHNHDSSDSSFATDYEAIGSLYCSLGDYGNAVCFYYRCLELQEKTNGVMSVEAAQAFMNYGIVCYYKGEFGTSLEYFNKALDIFKKRLKPTALETRNAQEWIDVVKASTGNEFLSYK